LYIHAQDIISFVDVGKECSDKKWLGFKNFTRKAKHGGQHEAPVSIIPFPQQPADCDGRVTKVRARFRWPTPKLGVEVWQYANQTGSVSASIAPVE